MKIKSSMILNKVGDKYIGVPDGDDGANRIVKLNETGYEIWCYIEKGLTVDEITGELVKQYDGVTVDEIKNDVTDVVKLLSDKGIIEI